MLRITGLKCVLQTDDPETDYKERLTQMLKPRVPNSEFCITKAEPHHKKTKKDIVNVSFAKAGEATLIYLELNKNGEEIAKRFLSPGTQVRVCILKSIAEKVPKK